MSFDSLTSKQIANKLNAQDACTLDDKFPSSFFDSEPRAAAVLIPLMRVDDGWHVIFIRRTQRDGDRHGGQVAFPGGGADPVDASIRDTALREAEEEISLAPRDVRVLGQMGEVRSITNYRVTPFVGTLTGRYPFQPDPIEAARVFSIPLSWLATPENQRIEQREIPPRGSWPVIYFSEYDGEVLWGFTAKLMVTLIEILK